MIYQVSLNSGTLKRMESFKFLVRMLDTYWDKDEGGSNRVDLGLVKDQINNFLDWVISTEWGMYQTHRLIDRLIDRPTKTKTVQIKGVWNLSTIKSTTFSTGSFSKNEV